MDRGKHAGFTLVELLIALLVAVFVLGMGVPGLSQFVANNQMAASANDITTALHVARSEAVKRRANVTVCASMDWNTDIPSCTNGSSFANGWIVFVDCSEQPPPNGTCGAPNMVVDPFDEVFSVHGEMPEAIADNFTTNPGWPQYVTYAATGFPRQIGNGASPKTDFQLCDYRGNVDTGDGTAAGRWIRISPTGRPQIFSDKADLQSALNPLGGC